MPSADLNPTFEKAPVAAQSALWIALALGLSVGSVVCVGDEPAVARLRRLELTEVWTKDVASHSTIAKTPVGTNESSLPVLATISDGKVFSVCMVPYCLNVHSSAGELVFAKYDSRGGALGVVPFGDGALVLKMRKSDSLEYVTEAKSSEGAYFTTNIPELQLRDEPVMAVSAGQTIWLLLWHRGVCAIRGGHVYRRIVRQLEDDPGNTICAVHERQALVASADGDIMSFTLDENLEVIKRDWSVNSSGPKIVSLHRSSFYSAVQVLDSNGLVSTVNLDTGVRSGSHQIDVSGEIVCSFQRQHLTHVACGTSNGAVIVADWNQPNATVARQVFSGPVLSVSLTDEALTATDENGHVTYFSIAKRGNRTQPQ